MMADPAFRAEPRGDWCVTMRLADGPVEVWRGADADEAGNLALYLNQVGTAARCGPATRETAMRLWALTRTGDEAAMAAYRAACADAELQLVRAARTMGLVGVVDHAAIALTGVAITTFLHALSGRVSPPLTSTVEETSE